MSISERMGVAADAAAQRGDAGRGWNPPAPTPNSADRVGEFKSKVHDALFARLGSRLFDAKSEDDLRSLVVAEIASLMEANGTALSTQERQVLVHDIARDVMGLGPKGEVWVIECKSSRADFMTDQKWQNYLPWCDRFFWAVPADFPLELLPNETGLMLADAYDAEILRFGPETKLAGARRKVLTQKFARHAALRLRAFRDPGVSALVSTVVEVEEDETWD